MALPQAARRPTPRCPLPRPRRRHGIPNATSVTLSDEAKAYLAASDERRGPAGNPRGQCAPILRPAIRRARHFLRGAGRRRSRSTSPTQDRATLSAVASNAQGLFSQDEVDAATKTLQVRFDDAVSPYVVIARHTGDYAAPYDAALNYLNKAGVDEQATPAWKNEYQAVLDGLAAAKSAFGKAPDTGNPDDPVRALLGRTSSSGSPSAATDSAGITARARAMLDAQANAARDNGTELTFDRSRNSGQQVDYTDFDNRSLASIALNPKRRFLGPGNPLRQGRAGPAQPRQHSRSLERIAIQRRYAQHQPCAAEANCRHERRREVGDGIHRRLRQPHRAKLPDVDVAAGSGRIEFGDEPVVAALKSVQTTFSSFCRQRTTPTSGGIGVSGKLVFQSVTPTSPT